MIMEEHGYNGKKISQGFSTAPGVQVGKVPVSSFFLYTVVG